MSELDIKNVRDLEDLIIEAIYAGELLDFGFCWTCYETNTILCFRTNQR